MDCFDTHYYWLNRKMLTIFGQWPYQKYADRVKIWIVYTCIMITGVIVQVGRAVKAEEMDFDLYIEFVSEMLVSATVIVRYLTYIAYDSRIRRLLDIMKHDWQNITNKDEYEILCESAAQTKDFMLQYATFAFSGTAMFSATMLSSPLLIYTPFFNESCPILMMYSKEYILDPQKYCVPLLVHICVVISVLLLAALTTDMMYMAILYHAVTMFKIVCYRLEHSFDQYLEGARERRTIAKVNKNIARAVERHRSAIKFGEDIGEAFQMSNLVSLMLTLLSIAVALYWAAMSKGQGLKPVFAMAIGGGVMVHLFFMDLPSQKMIDTSSDVIFRAYCGSWYLAPAKEQTLLLLTMQRGLKPTAMVMGKLHAATLENYAAEVQASFSYFTLLMSIQ